MNVKYTVVFCKAILLALVLFWGFMASGHARAAILSAPVHYISMEFNLQAGSLRANSRIDLPAGSDLHLDFSSLHIFKIIVNGQQQPVEGIEELTLPPSTEDQELLITYGKKILSATNPYSLISEAGITLTDNWYPVADREMLFKLTVHIPGNFEAVSEANEIISFPINNKKQVSFRFPHPLYSINFIAGPYEVTEEGFGEGKTLAAYFFSEDRELAADYLAKAKQYLERYEKMLGPYPYDRFSVVENRMPTGFAMPTYTMLGQSVVRLPFIVDTSLGHEVLHAWFGNGVRMSLQEGNWVEGLTTYLADQAYADDRGRGTEYRKGQLVKYQSYVRPDMGLTLRDFSNVGHNQGSGRPIRAVGYNKSSMFFHMLKTKVGPEKFYQSLQDFYKLFRYKTAGWSGLQRSFETTTGLDLGPFFEQWLDRADIPVLAVEQAVIKNATGQPVLHLAIVQGNKTPYTLDVPMTIKTVSEETQKKLTISESRSVFEIPLSSVPLTLVMDPQYDLMRSLTDGELPATWSRFLGAGRKLAILPSEKHQEVYGPLLKQLEDAEGLILTENEVTDKDLAQSSLLFLGSEGSLSRSLFASPDHPAKGFTLDVRENPLNKKQVAVLVSGADSDQVEKAAGKLRHYGKYSYLSFDDGRILEKNIAETDSGMQVLLESLPHGIETGRSETFDDIIAKLLPHRVVYVGEGHTSYEDHKLQLEIIRALHAQDPNLAIGMEMFNRPSQPVIDRYLAGELDEKTFLKDSHYFKTWQFDYRLYRDIINFAKHNSLPLVALNMEKDIVSQVYKNGGPASLSDEDAGLLPDDRKLDVPGYRERIESAYMMHGSNRQKGDFSGFFQAQAIWDETMAQTIADYLESHPDDRMVVIAGRGHVDKKNAIPPRVVRRLPVSQAVVLNSIGSTNESDSADYIFFSPPASLSPFPLLGVLLGDNAEDNGVLVTALQPKGQAQKAGIKEKDIILSIDSEPVNDIEDLKIAMLYKIESDSVMVRVKRPAFLFGDRLLDIEVELKNSAPHHPM